ncbi:MAG TPA: gliding motility-associated protein GldE [Flavobacterium sp.]
MDPEPSIGFSVLDTNLLIGYLAIFILLFCSALVSAAEVALFSLTPKDLETATAEDPAKASIISRLLQKPKKLLATILVANTFTSIGAIIIFFRIGHGLFSGITSDQLKFALEVITITFFILLFGEVLPKIYANRNNIRFSKFIAGPMSFLDRLLTPISMPMREISLYLHERLGKQKTNLSVDQLSQALELTSSEGTSHEEQKILEGIVSFGSTDTKQVMSPRIDIFAFEITCPFAEILPKIIEKGFSRIPVYRDNIDNIEGILYVKDLLPYISEKEFDWTTLIREPFFVPENKKLDNLLKDFQGMKSHLAIVVDEYGGTSGLVSLEDVIEEIVGDISDEFDDDNITYSQIDEHNFLFEGKIYLKDFYRIIDVEEELFEEAKGEAETLGGFILELLGNFPKKGQKINFGKCRFIIISIDKKRIKQIKVTLDRTQ